MENPEISDERQYVQYKDQINPDPVVEWTYRKYEYTGMPVEYIVMRKGQTWLCVPHEDRAKAICQTFNAFIESQLLIIRNGERFMELDKSYTELKDLSEGRPRFDSPIFKKIVTEAYDQGDLDGHNDRATGTKDRDYKNAQDYYERNFKYD